MKSKRQNSRFEQVMTDSGPCVRMSFVCMFRERRTALLGRVRKSLFFILI